MEQVAGIGPQSDVHERPARSRAAGETRAKTRNACQRCRRKKIKCSGHLPCQNCFGLPSPCTFEDVGRRVLVSEKHLQHLRSTIARYEQQETAGGGAGISRVSSTSHCADQEISSDHAHSSSVKHVTQSTAIASIQTPDQHSNGYLPPPSSWFPARNSIEGQSCHDAGITPLISYPKTPKEAPLHHQGTTTSGEPSLVSVQDPLPLIGEAVSSVRNPLTSSQSFFLTDSSGKQRYLGSSSSWSFSWQIRSFLKEATGSNDSIDLTPRSEEDTYSIASASARQIIPLHDYDIPPRDYAEYLTNTTLFHLGATYHLFDKESFMHNLDQHYNGNLSNDMKDLWHVQFLLVVAFGKLFLRRRASTLGPPGAVEFLQALKLKPNVLESWENPILSIEILCMMSLYLLTVDMRSSAYTFIGEAVRMAFCLGMNREIPPGSLEKREYERRRRLWWTLYIIDRKLSINMGAPLTVDDRDIDISMPKEKDLGFDNSALILHAKLAMLEGNVMTSAYKINGTLDKAFILGLQGVLYKMTSLAENFTGKFDLNLNRQSRVSRVAATLQIMYYQCAIMITRPIMFTLVKQRMAPPGDEIAKTVSDAVVALLQTCIGAATTIIKILSSLHEQDLIEPFLPFDLQAVFSAGFIITLTTIAYPLILIDASCITTADMILDWMACQGNAPAKSRRKELQELQQLATEINTSRNSPSFSSKNDGQGYNWLWNAVDIDGGASESDLLSSIDLIGLNSFGDGISEEMAEQYWFWARNEEQDRNSDLNFEGANQ